MAYTPEQRRAYQKAYREKKKAERQLVASVTKEFGPEVAKTIETKPRDLPVGDLVPPKSGHSKWSEVKRRIVPDDVPMYPGSDRKDGLPRSNYFGDNINAWQQTIQKMPTKQIDYILNRIATKQRPMK